MGIGNGHLGHLCAEECIVSNIDQGFGRSECACNTAIGKGIVINTFDLAVLGNWNSINLCTTVESKIQNFSDGFRKRNVGKIRAAQESTLIDSLQLVAFREGHCLQILTVSKGIGINRHNTGRDRNLRQKFGLEEGTMTESKDIGILMEDDFGKLTFLKSTETYFFHRQRYRKTSGSSGRNSNQLSSALIQKKTIHGYIIGVAFFDREFSRI